MERRLRRGLGGPGFDVAGRLGREAQRIRQGDHLTDVQGEVAVGKLGPTRRHRSEERLGRVRLRLTLHISEGGDHGAHGELRAGLGGGASDQKREEGERGEPHALHGGGVRDHETKLRNNPPPPASPSMRLWRAALALLPLISVVLTQSSAPYPQTFGQLYGWC